MNRLQKKCVIVTTGFHLLLLVILFVGPGFLSADKPESFTMLEIIPQITTDLNMQGGGSPEAKPPPPAPPAPPVAQPQPPTPEQPKEIVRRKKLEKEITLKPVKNETPKPDFVLKPVKNPARATNTKPPPEKSPATERDPAREQAKQFANAAQNAARSIRENTSTRTTVEMPAGNGGPAYANYKQVLASIYYQNWSEPDDANADDGTVVASVTVSREGKVLSTSITKSSGNRAVDRSVEAVLNRVKTIAPFPEGTSDEKRTFTVNFNAKAKQKLG